MHDAKLADRESSSLMKDSRLALVFPERRINESCSRGKFLRGLLIDAVYGRRDVLVKKKEEVEQGPDRNRQAFVRRHDECVTKLRKKHVACDETKSIHA